MAQFIQKGDIVDYTNSGDTAIEYGQIVVGKDKVFVAAEQIGSGTTGGVYAEGVFEFKTSDATAIEYGQKMYFNAANKVATTTSTNNALIGYAVQNIAASAGDKKILVKLA